jgi:hypothetical protein
LARTVEEPTTQGPASTNLARSLGRRRAGSSPNPTADEIDAASNQSLVPSSLGMTFCVDGDAERIEVEVRWGRYERSDEHEIFRTRKNKETRPEEQTKAKVWQRIPCGGSWCCRSPKA